MPTVSLVQAKNGLFLFLYKFFEGKVGADNGGGNYDYKDNGKFPGIKE